MRNRVGHHGVQSKVNGLLRTAAAVTMLPVAIMMATAQVAGAEPALDGVVAANHLSTGVAGPVGIGAVLIGLGGLVAGLVRRRRTSIARSAAVPSPVLDPLEPARATARGDHGA